jgi:hypothetical protein
MLRPRIRLRFKENYHAYSLNILRGETGLAVHRPWLAADAYRVMVVEVSLCRHACTDHCVNCSLTLSQGTCLVTSRSCCWMAGCPVAARAVATAWRVALLLRAQLLLDGGLPCCCARCCCWMAGSRAVSLSNGRLCARSPYLRVFSLL